MNKMRYLMLFIFVTGMSITSLEMAASKFLAPYFGSSIIVWSNVIGVILAALALGYWYGGKVADKYPKFKVFYGIGIIAGILLSLIPLIAQVVVNPFYSGVGFYGLASGEVVGSFIFTLFLFGIPVFFLAALSPFAVKLASKNIHVVGKKAGK